MNSNGVVYMADKTTGKKRIVKVTLFSLAAFFLLFSVISMIAVKFVYDSQFPRFAQPRYLSYPGYADVEGYGRTTVHFESGRNTLTGYIYGAENTKGLVVIAHGLGCSEERYLPETMFFVDNGWRVFTFDCTGSYESEGSGTVGLPQSVLDLDAALTFAEGDSTLKGLPVMLFGHSWGGYAVTAILNYSHDISASVSVSGFSDPNRMLAEQSDHMMGFLSFFEYPFEMAYQTMLFGKAASLSAVDGINKSDTPVLIIHGTEDQMVSYTGASIISRRAEITNPNVIYVTCSREGNNGHNSLLLSEAAVAYIDKENDIYKELFDSYDGNIPDSVKAEYYAGLDTFLTSDPDRDLLNKINGFYEKSLEQGA